MEKVRCAISSLNEKSCAKRQYVDSAMTRVEHEHVTVGMLKKAQATIFSLNTRFASFLPAASSLFKSACISVCSNNAGTFCIVSVTLCLTACSAGIAAA